MSEALSGALTPSQTQTITSTSPLSLCTTVNNNGNASPTDTVSAVNSVIRNAIALVALIIMVLAWRFPARNRV
ncbi:hypothetical protein LTR10_009105 [Elasticomyces elasticus]|nr:hypothetical protein LTR10_009105 [Elasticomyces elasticus]KAK4964674.1 hypothetical protein LTR42_012617 [Elasticomyces elasticus]